VIIQQNIKVKFKTSKNTHLGEIFSLFFSVIRRRKMSAFSGVRVGIRFDIRFGMSIN
jgi:hypothetical protein